MKYLLAMVLLFTMACSKDNSSGSGVIDTTPTVEAKSCAGLINRAFTDVEIMRIVEFYSDCTGAIPSCEVNFRYDITSIDNTGGTLVIQVDSSPTASDCRGFFAGETYACGFSVDNYGQSMRGIYMNCGAETVYLENRNGVR